MILMAFLVIFDEKLKVDDFILRGETWVKRCFFIDFLKENENI